MELVKTLKFGCDGTPETRCQGIPSRRGVNLSNPLRGEPLTRGARMWTPSQFPLTVKLRMNLNTGELLPEEVQLERLGYGRTRAVYSMPSAGPYSKYGDCVLKLWARQSHGKEAEWGRQCSLVAATVHTERLILDLGQENKELHFNVQKRAVMVQDWLARWKNNPTLVSDMAMYLLATLLSLELRGVVLCDVGPTNAMVRSLDPYARVVFGDVAGWSLHKKPRHRGVGGFVNIFSGLTASAGRSGAHLDRGQADQSASCLQIGSKQLWQVRSLSRQ